MKKSPRTTAKTPPRRQQLDHTLAQARQIILARQNADTGLLPASTAITVHGDYTHAWVRDNVYSILAVWALALAYRHEHKPTAAALEHNVVQLMRGLLAAMMKQAAKVERFKHTQDPLDALHAKYATTTGEPVVGDAEWGHLQVDATAIFVLQLAQMSASGLAIVQSADEAAFVQNLVHYLARAYRTPDYGIWERGHKRNEGVAEINASSLGMAKAALEAIAGFEPLPGEAPAIHVLADDIALARETLEALLPRESESKETDAALLSIVGYPAFAVDDPLLAARTRALIVEKLQGRYGCKRFLRDGHQTAVEDHARLHYEPGELRNFEHIESEWPLFFTYLLLDAALRGDTAEAADYRRRLDALMQERDGQLLLPELYYVPADAVDAERALPHSQTRLPNDNVPLVWAQSLYIVGVLVQEGYVSAAELNPLDRPPFHEPATVCVQVAILAADELVQGRLASHGIAAQTPAELKPLQLRDAGALAALLAQAGASAALGLSGRPPHRIGSLATGQVYTVGAETVVFLPSIFGPQSGYLSLDNRLLVDAIAAELATLRRHWHGAGQPLLALWVGETVLDAGGAEVLLDFLRGLTAQASPDIQVGTIARLMPVLETTRIDWATQLPADPPPAPAAPNLDAALAWEEGATRALTADRASALARETDSNALLAALERSRNPYEQVEVLGLLWQRHGPAWPTPLGGTVGELTLALYQRACRRRLWGVLRRAAGLMEVHDSALSDAVVQIVVRGKRVSLARNHDPAGVIARPVGSSDLMHRLRESGGEDPRGRVLIQESVQLLGTLIRTDAELFKGTLTLRPWRLLLLVTAWLAREHGVGQAEAFDHLLDLSPHAILGRLREAIAREQELASNLERLQHLHHSGDETLVSVSFSPTHDPAQGAAAGGWMALREAAGAVARVPDDFYQRSWELLHHCTGLVVGDELDARNTLDSSIAQADMTQAERSFELAFDDLLDKIQAPEYRQLTVEALLALSDIFRANPDLKLDGTLVVDVVLATAVRLGWCDGLIDALSDDEVAEAWRHFYALPPHQVADLVMAAVAFLLAPA
jgi:phosphorylase kinase alpha/beta subunit